MVSIFALKNACFDVVILLVTASGYRRHVKLIGVIRNSVFNGRTQPIEGYKQTLPIFIF